MSIAALFTVVIAALLLRVFVLHWRRNRLDAKEFQELPRATQLAILKERLLETPSVGNLENLRDFCHSYGNEIDIESYRPLLAEQLRLSEQENAIALDDDLYAKESVWIDTIEPLEFNEAKEALAKGDKKAYIDATLAGVLRYYSDEKIENSLEQLVPDYEKAGEILADYLELKELRNLSEVDESSIKRLEDAKNAWVQKLINA